MRLGHYLYRLWLAVTTNKVITIYTAIAVTIVLILAVEAR